MDVWVVLQDKKSRIFRQIFSSQKAAEDYIICGIKAGDQFAKQEFVEKHYVRDS